MYFSNFHCITCLNNRCHPEELRDFVEHWSQDPEEFPFMEEQSILRRLEATLFTLRNWSVTKSKAAVNNWQVRDFVLITQGDLLNTQDCYTLLQVSLVQFYALDGIWYLIILICDRFKNMTHIAIWWRKKARKILPLIFLHKTFINHIEKRVQKRKK